MIKKSIFIILVIFLIQISPAFAADITFSLDQQEYYFLTSEEAIIPLTVKNSYGIPMEGTLNYVVTQKVKQGSLYYSSSNTQSTYLVAKNGENTLSLNFGTWDSPVTLSVDMEYTYNDGARKTVKLDNIKIHFVENKSDFKNEKNPVSATSRPYQPDNNTNDPFGGGSPFNSDPFQRMEEMDKRMEEMLREQQEQMNRMFSGQRPTMPPGMSPPQPGGTPGQNLQNNQIPQDSQALKESIQKKMEKQKKLKKNFQENLAKNENFQKKHEELTKEGYELKEESYTPSDENTGEFQMEYEKKNGDKATLEGKVNEGEIEKLESFTAEDKEKLQQKLNNNKEFKKYSDILDKEGYKRKNTTFEKEDDKIEARVEFKNDEGDTREITAEYEDGEISKVEMEELKPDKPERNFWWLIPLTVLILVMGYLTYKKLSSPVKMDKNTGEKKKKPLNYREEAGRLLKKARELFEAGQAREAYATANRAIRLYLSHRHNLNREITNDELISYLKKNRLPYQELKECFDLCTMVEFAKYDTNEEDFEKVMKTASEKIN
ncbi:MAG: hypothetical protein ACLFQV_03120 [Vulcanimicrobiota bacterium]